MADTYNYDEIRFTDDFMFCSVLENNEDICRDLVELVLGVKIDKIYNLDAQNTVKVLPDGKGIRMDVSFEGDDKIYDIEMQNRAKRELPKRARYYQSLTDIDVMKSGAKYPTLKDSVIIFICIFDPFDAGLSKYTVKSLVEEDPKITYNDGVTKIFLNADGKAHEDVTVKMREFLDYLGGRSQSGDLAGKVERAMEELKSQETWRKEYMQIREREAELREDGRAEGIEQGILQGAQKRNHEIAKSLKSSGMEPEMIAKHTGLSIEAIESL